MKILEHDELEQVVLIESTCVSCHEVGVIALDYFAFSDWQDGKLIQDAFPDLPVGARERLITSLCEDCQI